MPPTKSKSKTAPAPVAQKRLTPDWSATDPFEHLPRYPMHCEMVFGSTVRCESCSRDCEVMFYVKVEKSIDGMCQHCLLQQTRASATRDTLVRVVGVVWPDGRKPK